MKYIDLLRPNINNIYLLRNVMYEIIVFEVHKFLMLIIIIFYVEMIKNDYLWSPFLPDD